MLRVAVRGISILSCWEFVAAWALFGGAADKVTTSRLFQSMDGHRDRSSVSSLLGKARNLFRDCGSGSSHGKFKPVNQETKDETMMGYTEIVDYFGRGALERRQSGSGSEDDIQLVRLEKEPDSVSLENIATREDVVKKIREVILEQGRFGCAELYAREWQCRESLEEKSTDVKRDLDDNDTLLCDKPALRNGHHDPQVHPNPVATFTAMQFNALAEGLSSGPNVGKPFNNLDSDGMRKDDSKKGGYGGFTSLPHPSVVLDFQWRKWRLLEILLGSNGEAEFDLIAMQEVDRYRGFFAPVLDIFGYDGLFVPKPRSPGAQMGWYSDGCALMWKRGVFSLVSERRSGYTVGNQVHIVATLRHLATGQFIVVAVTHLKAQRGESNEWTRCRQVEELLEAVDDEASTVTSRTNVATVPILLLGDFNADPPSKPRGFKESAIEHLLTHDVGSASTGSPNHSRRYQSAYSIIDPKSNLYTTWKIRGSTTTKRIIDYMFYYPGGKVGETTNQLQCTATLQVPPGDSLERSKLPGLRYPSDHLHIGARFELRVPE
jgi:mRNA deadenylase 3'-5' endonuclease subunit Ccr4